MIKKKPAPFKWAPLSKKQMQVYSWWSPISPHRDKDIIIADGSIRAGKTVIMSYGYIKWAMSNFNGENLGMAGKTIGSFRRNVVEPLKRILRGRGYKVKDKRSDNLLEITYKGVTNFFYIFGGKDESSQDLIQGITLAGMLFDEVALMPQSFVNQATGRCSVEGSKMWFNCNPAGPNHWFKKEYLDQLEQKNALHLHFTMDDNPSLSEKVKERYKRLYTGLFYQRFILGLWVLAEGIVYDIFNEDEHVVPTKERRYRRYHVSVDYGTQNPMAYGLWGFCDGIWYKIKEYHHSGRESSTKTNDEYVKDLIDWLAEENLTPRDVKSVIVDPSAASFKTQLRRAKFRVVDGKNDVLEGIEYVQMALANGLIKYNDCNKNTLEEFSSYVWDEKAADKGIDRVIQMNDHHMDSDRYFVRTVLKKDIDKLMREDDMGLTRALGGASVYG